MPRKKTPEQLFSIDTRVPRDTYDRLVRIAEENERSIAAELRRAVRSHLKKEEALA